MSESRELTASAPAPVAAVTIPMDQQMAMMNKALTDPDVDPAKAREMFALMREMMNDAKQAQFNADKIAAKREMPAIYKRGFNTHQKTKHVLFEDMQRAIDPVLDRHNLMLDFEVGNVGNDIAVTPILRHTNGWIERGGTLKGPPDQGPGRSAIQSVGSSAHYLCRYAAEAMLNLVRDGEDNDGVNVGRADYKLNDRQEALVADAQEAFERGQYGDWYGKLPAKDKAFLVTAGHHARYGGGTALPSASARPGQPVEQERRDDPPAASEQESPTVKKLDQAQQQRVHDTNTPEGWAGDYVDRMKAATDIATVDRLKSKGARGLGLLLDGNQALWDKCDAAELDARDRLKTGGLI